MPADPHLDRVRALAARVAGDYGLEIFDVQLRRESVGWVLRVVIDRPVQVDESGGVRVETPEQAIGIADCQRVSQDLDALLDVDEVLDRRYVLEVSSPGLDRPLRGPDDYRRFAGRLAKVVVHEPVEGQSHFAGRLRGVEGEAVLIEGRRQRVTAIPLANVSRARLEVEF